MNYIIIIIIFSLITNTNIYSQKACDVPSDFYSYPFGFPHVANVLGDSGFALNISYPGIWSYIGQANLYYTNLNGDSFLFGVGLPYLMAGINKKMIVMNNNSGFLYLNGNLMYFEDLSGSIGFSSVFVLESKNYFEIDFDLFYFSGINGDMIIPNVPESYGSIINLNYIFSMKHLNFILSAGAAFTKFFSYHVYYSSGFSTCTSREKPIWTEVYLNFPIGVSISLKF